MQLSGRSKGSSNIVRQLQQLNGVVKQPLWRHRNNESAESTNSKSTDGESVSESGHTSSPVNERVQAPPELRNSNHKVDTDDTESSIANLDDRMEIAENGTSEMNEQNENFDRKLAAKGETERSSGVIGMEVSVDGERMKDEKGREGAQKGGGQGRGGELSASEEHIEVSKEEEECSSNEQGHPQGSGRPEGSGHQPGFGKHQGDAVVYTDQENRQYTLCYDHNNIIHTPSYPKGRPQRSYAYSQMHVNAH